MTSRRSDVPRKVVSSVRKTPPKHLKQPPRGLTLLELVVVLGILVALATMLVPLFNNVSDDSRQTVTRESLRQLQNLILNRYKLDMQGVLPSISDPYVYQGLPGPNPDPNFLLPSSRSLQPQMAFLFVNPSTNSGGASPKNSDVSTFDPVVRRGWHGPYILPGNGGIYPGADPSTAAARGFDATYGVADVDSAALDAWGNPIVMKLVLQPDSTERMCIVSAGPDGDLTTTFDNLSLALQ